MIADNVLHSLVMQITGATVIWMNENAPRPPLPYVGIKISPARRIGKDWYSDVSDTGLQTVVGDREFTLSIQCYGEDSPVSYLQDVADKLQLVSVGDKFRREGMAIRDSNPVLDISALLSNTKIEKRANLDVIIGYRSIQTDNVGIIERAEIEGRDNGINSPVYTIVASI